MKKKFKIVGLVLAIVTMLGVLVACTLENTEPVVEATETVEAETVETEVSVTETNEKDINELEQEKSNIKEDFLVGANEVIVDENTVTFIDGSGRESVTIKKQPQKVAVLYGSYTNLWYEMGGQATGLIGGSSSVATYEENIGRDITQDEGVTVLTTSSSGSKWDIESIVAFQPDLIICSTAMSGYSTISGPAEAAGIPVIAIEYNNLSDYMKWCKVFTSITGNEDIYEEIAVATLDKVIDVLVQAQEEEESKILSLWMASSSVSANLSGTLVGDMLNDLEAVNVADIWDDSNASRVEFNLEQIVVADPDYILVYGMSDEEGATEAAIEELYGADPVWNSLRAVQNDEVIYLERGLFHYRPNSNYDKAYKVLAENIYPEIEFE